MAWVLFDYGGVVSKWPSQEELESLAAVAGAPLAKFSDAYWQRRSAFDRAEVDALHYWQQVGLILGRGSDYDSGELAELVRLDTDSWLHLEPGTVEMIEELSAGGHRLALLSNAPEVIASAITELPVASYFEHLVFSCRVGAAKPDRACYEAALGELRATAEEVIFLDDRADNLTAAAAMGMRTILFSDSDQARGELAELLVRDLK
jgi:putative hydrolase of the HAD superfamily